MKIQVSVGVIKKDNKFLIGKRKLTEKIYPGKWEFPGGKSRGYENPKETLYREINEELGIYLTYLNIKLIWEGKHPNLEEYNISFWHITTNQNPKLIVHDAISFETKEEIFKRDNLCNPLMLKILNLL